jgi:hypothetical protein
MNIKLKPFSKVNTLSNIFYTDSNVIDTNLVVDIFKSSHLSFSTFLNKHCSILKKKSLSSKNSRLKYILSNFEKQEFREKWYKSIENKKQDKQLNNFHHLIYRYITKEYHFLDIESPDVKDCLWANNVGRTFLLKSGIKGIIEVCNSNNLSKRKTALYFWAFLDAHIWNAAGFSPNEPFYSSSDTLLNAFKDSEEDELINYFSPPSIPLTKSEGITSPQERKKTEKAKIPIVNDLKSQKELKKLNKLVENFFVLKKEIQSHLDSNELKETLKKSEKLDALKKSYEQKFNNFRISLNKKYSANIIKSSTKEILVSFNQECKYLQKIEGSIFKASKSVSKEIEKEKVLISKKFRALGVQLPEKISGINTIEGMNEFKNHWDPILLKEKIYNHCIKKGFKNSSIETLGYEYRFKVYSQLYENKDSNFIDYNSLLSKIITDPDLLNISKENNLELTLFIVKDYLKNGIPLPKNIWTSIKELNSGKLISVLQQEKILSLIKNEKTIDIENFLTEFDGLPDQLPENLRFQFELQKINFLDAENRVQKLSTLMLDSNNKAQIGKVLLLSLYELKRYDEAFYLAAIGSKMQWLDLADNDLHDLIFIVMCKNIEDSNTIQVIKEIFDNFGLISERPEDVVLLLFFCTFGNLFDDIYINFQYQKPNLYASVIKSFPVISNYFISKIEERDISSYKRPDFDNIVYRGYAALKKFNSDLNKHSCFVNWPEAKKYQTHFIKKFELELLNIKNGNNLNLSAEDIINTTQKELKLKVVNNKVKTKMLHYLNNQIERLKVLQQALKYVSLEKLYTTKNQIKKKIVKESSTVKNQALKYLYDKVEKGL